MHGQLVALNVAASWHNEANKPLHFSVYLPLVGVSEQLSNDLCNRFALIETFDIVVNRLNDAKPTHLTAHSWSDKYEARSRLRLVSINKLRISGLNRQYYFVLAS